MDNSIMPVILWIMLIPNLPSFASIHSECFKTRYMSNKLTSVPQRTLIVLYVAFRVIRVAKVPVPTIIGKANGTTEDDSVSVSILNILMFKLISIPSRNKITLPARAKELVSTENRASMVGPINRKVIMMMPTTVAVFLASMYPIFFRMLMMMAILPSTSTAAKSIRKAEENFLRSKSVKNS